MATTNTLDRITARDRRLVDSRGRQVILRGLVTITSDIRFFDTPAEHPPRPVGMAAEDYARFQEWGFNSQFIRLDADKLGASPDTEFQPEYLDLLDEWTTLAARYGVYTGYKMTIYRIPSWWNRALDPSRWNDFWLNKDGQQDKLIEGWQRVWDRFKGRPEVFGYDLLNEPYPGTTAKPVMHDYMIPFYQRAANTLRQVDKAATVCLQPLNHWDETPEPIDDPNYFLVPHLYPFKLHHFDKYTEFMMGMANSAGTGAGVPEYGWPDVVVGPYPSWTEEGERAYADVLDRYGLSCWRVWYTYSGMWQVLNPDLSEQKEKMDILSRAYPQRAAGTHTGWQYDIDARSLRLEIAPSDASAPNEIYVPVRRHYPRGFRVAAGSAVLVSDASRPSGLRAESGTLDASFDFGRQLLSLSPSEERVNIALDPL